MRRLALMIGMGVLVLAACSDDGGGGAELAVTATDFMFEPADHTATAGEEATVQVLNESGNEAHSWVVMKQDASAEEYIESIANARLDPDVEIPEDVFLVKAFAGQGQEGDPETFTIDEPGTYRVVCDIPGHLDEGMEGTLVVE